MSLVSIDYSRGSLKLMDQRKLPLNVVYDSIETKEDIYNAIKEMRVRGAPAIAVSAALGIAVAASRLNELQVVDLRTWLNQALDYVATSRPTAVNLSNAVCALKEKLEGFTGSRTELLAFYTALAEQLYSEDIEINTGIMTHGARYILSSVAAGEKINILTICNTGALATTKFGTALGVVRQVFADGRLNRVYACETRPWNQGSRLTVFECVHEKIPVTLIVDNAASSLMRSQKIHAVIVGADRVCENGDTANKIGTYNLAVSAKFHCVPFFVAVPSPTLDPSTAHGGCVTIEERAANELTHFQGVQQVIDGDCLQIWNPVFDITPAELITGGLITEKGVFPPMENAPFYSAKLILATK